MDTLIDSRSGLDGRMLNRLRNGLPRIRERVAGQPERAGLGPWRDIGTRPKVSGEHGLTGAAIGAGDLICAGGDYKIEPMFTARERVRNAS